jgi:DNA helicase HerA-like ATPase
MNVCHKGFHDSILYTRVLHDVRDDPVYDGDDSSHHIPTLATTKTVMTLFMRVL